MYSGSMSGVKSKIKKVKGDNSDLTVQTLSGSSELTGACRPGLAPANRAPSGRKQSNPEVQRFCLDDRNVLNVAD